jgi:Holliday junction resolvase RusA-like endonuclease
MTFFNLPFPPSVNSLYVTDFRTKRRFKSKEGRQFQTDMHLWALDHIDQIKLFTKGPCYKLRLTFFIAKDKLLTKDDRLKKLDVSNRVKPIEDALCNLLEIDDKDFLEIIIQKTLSPRDSSWVDATIIPLDLPPEKYFKNDRGSMPDLPGTR